MAPPREKEEGIQYLGLVASYCETAAFLEVIYDSVSTWVVLLLLPAESDTHTVCGYGLHVQPLD